MKIQSNKNRKLVAVISHDSGSIWVRNSNGDGSVCIGGNPPYASRDSSQNLEAMVAGRHPIYEGDSITITF